MTVLRRTVSSYDVFDTLLARRCVTSLGLFSQVETNLNAAGFATARHAAEQQLAAAGRPFDIYAIYEHLINGKVLARPDAMRLMEAEIDAEFDNAVPIMENLQQVVDGDLAVSDMYLPREVIRRLLNHVGLRRHVDIVVTNLGKHTGTIWPHIKQRWLINRHLGDNPHSDIAMPHQHGIHTVHYTGAGFTQIEQNLSQAGLHALARIARTLRLINPYPASTPQGQLWLLATQANLPLLVLFAAQARSERDRLKRHHLLFSARDCYFLAEVFAALFPTESSSYIYVSREALSQQSENMRRYLLNAGLEHALVCDIAATGSSWFGFAETNAVQVALLSLVFIDNWKLAQVSPERVAGSNHMLMHWMVRSSEIANYSTALEVLNTAPHGTCVGFESGEGISIPVLEKTSEFDPALHSLLLQAHNAATSELRRHRREILPEIGNFKNSTLPRSLLEIISAAPLLISLGEKLQWPKHYGRTTN